MSWSSRIHNHAGKDCCPILVVFYLKRLLLTGPEFIEDSFSLHALLQAVVLLYVYTSTFQLFVADDVCITRICASSVRSLICRKDMAFRPNWYMKAATKFLWYFMVYA